MLHIIAFVVIGLAVGAALYFGLKAKNPAVTIIVSLVGSLVGGEVVEHGLGATTGKYPSLLAAIIIAAVAGWLVGRNKEAVPADKGTS